MASYSPDGKWIAFSASDGPVHWAQSNRINIVPASGGTAKVMPLSHDGQAGIIGWSMDGSKGYFNEGKGTGTSLYSANVGSATITEEQTEDAVITGLNLNSTGTTWGFVRQRACEPAEVFVVKMGDQTPTQITRFNDEFTKIPTGRTELIKWKSSDGRAIEGLLTYPAGYKAGDKVPMIVNIHGGPAGVFHA